MSLLLLALVGALLALDNVSVGQTMLSRPLPTGFLIGALLGDPLTGTQVGALLELYLLVVVPAGGGRNPEGSVATAVGVSAALLAPGLTGLVFGVTGGLIWGWLAGFTQSVMRRGNDRRVPIPGESPVTESSVTGAQLSGVLFDFVRSFALILSGALLARLLVPQLLGAWVLPTGWTAGLLVGGGLVSAGVLFRALAQGRRKDWALIVVSALVGWWVAGGRMNRIPSSVHVSILARSLLVQASWNYRTMIGCGMAFALLPLRRYLGQTEVGKGAVDLELHASHFNAHPYLTSAALGSLARMEVEGTPSETIIRFRDAVRGPLGALGDRLVWAAWLPFCAVLGLGTFWAGAPPWVAVVAFLGPYNAGHIFLRLRGYALGWSEGPRLGMRLRESAIPGFARRVERLLMVALGLLVGVLSASGVSEGAGTDLHLPGAIALAAGALLGPRAWKPTAVVVVGIVGLVLAFGLLR